MNAAIASIHERISQGGDWMTFRDEISQLHGQARSQQEYVTLLEAFSNLIAVGPHAFDEGTWARISAVALGEYKLFLNVEAMEGQDLMSPVMLDAITAREVDAGRLAEGSEFRQFAKSGVALGDRIDKKHLSRPGNWLFYGTSTAGIALWLLGPSFGAASPLLLIPIGLIVGWFMNEGERRKAVQRQADDRKTRGYNI